MDDLKPIREMLRGEIERELASLWNTVNRYGKILEGNGQPSLERRMSDDLEEARASVMKHIEITKQHIQNNYRQADLLLSARLDSEHAENKDSMKEQKEATKANGAKIDRGTWLMGIGLGIVLTLQALMAAGVLRVGVK